MRHSIPSASASPSPSLATLLTPISSSRPPSFSNSRPAPMSRRKQVRWADPLPSKGRSTPRSPSPSPLASDLFRLSQISLLLARLKALEARVPLVPTSVPVPTPFPAPVPLMSLHISQPPLFLMSLKIPYPPFLLPSSSSSSPPSAPSVCPLAYLSPSSPMTSSARAKVCEICNRPGHGTSGHREEDWPRLSRERQ